MSSKRRSMPPKCGRADDGERARSSHRDVSRSASPASVLAPCERQVPVDEPPPLPPNSELAVIGKSFPRPNGRAKVTGAIRFTVDISLPGMLHARILRSPIPHARVSSIDIAAAARHPGVRAIVPIANPDNPRRAICAMSARRSLPSPRSRSPAAEEALRLIQVDYQSLPFVADMAAARARGRACGPRRRHSAGRRRLRVIPPLRICR